MTKELFNEIGPFRLPEMNINNDDQDFMFDVFSALPERIKEIAEICGMNGMKNTQFLDAAYTYVIDKVYGLSHKRLLQAWHKQAGQHAK